MQSYRMYGLLNRVVLQPNGLGEDVKDAVCEAVVRLRLAEFEKKERGGR